MGVKLIRTNQTECIRSDISPCSHHHHGHGLTVTMDTISYAELIQLHVSFCRSLAKEEVFHQTVRQAVYSHIIDSSACTGFETALSVHSHVTENHDTFVKFNFNITAALDSIVSEQTRSWRDSIHLESKCIQARPKIV